MPDVYSPINAQMSVEAALDLLTDFNTDLAARTNVEAWLYQNNVSPAPSNTLAAFTEATFSGYARVTSVTFSNEGLDPQYNAFITSALLTFKCNGGGVNNQIYGALIVASTPGGVIATATNAGNVGAYAASFVITNAGTKYIFPPKVTLNGATGSGATAHAVLDGNGRVAEIVLDTPGSAYTTFTVLIESPLELVKQIVLSQAGISMALATDVLVTYAQLIEPSAAA